MRFLPLRRVNIINWQNICFFLKIAEVLESIFLPDMSFISASVLSPSVYFFVRLCNSTVKINK